MFYSTTQNTQNTPLMLVYLTISKMGLKRTSLDGIKAVEVGVVSIGIDIGGRWTKRFSVHSVASAFRFW